jgi:hypothetical protein
MIEDYEAALYNAFSTASNSLSKENKINTVAKKYERIITEKSIATNKKDSEDEERPKNMHKFFKNKLKWRNQTLHFKSS